MKYLIKFTLVGLCVMSLVGCASDHQMTRNEANATVAGTVVGVSLGMLVGGVVSTLL